MSSSPAGSLSNRQLFLRNMAQTTDFPLLLEVERAEGIYLDGRHGERWADLISGIGVSNIGHRHPKVVQAVKDQADKYLHLMVYGEVVQAPQVQLAQAMLVTLPPALDCFYFVNSGSEAVEGALKLAKRHTGRGRLVSFNNAYHGSSQGALSVGGNEAFKQAFRPLLPEVLQLRFGNFNDLALIDNRCACVIVETIQGEAGVRLPPEGWLAALRQRCTETGALLILDEIQAGAGRTGRYWAFEHYNVVPDILVAAKGMGGGMPIGAFIAPQKIMHSLKENPMLGHITTFGGHPVSCAAAAACFAVLAEERVHEQAEARAELFRQRLRHPLVKEIRGKGLMMAVEFESFAVLKQIIDRAMERGLLTDWFLFCDNAMRLAPPLTITEAEIEESCGTLLQVLNQYQEGIASGISKG
jgi:acetylornithine/succinyldiaminopimelate/putrescine aminotransferase